MSISFTLKLLCCICFLQIVFTIYLVVKIYASSVVRPDQEDNLFQEKTFESKITDLEMESPSVPKDNPDINLNLNKKEKTTIAILGKAAIASYFWDHIFQGKRSLNEELHGTISGQLTLSNITFKYIEGPGLIPLIYPHISDKIILVGNGRTVDKVKDVKRWLQSFMSWHHPPDVLLFLLGNERCENGWLKSFLLPSGPLKGVFLTYDDPVIDGKTFFQWPLGVATYREFPLLRDEQLEISQKRKFMCNIQATNYPNSSRSALFQYLEQNSLSKMKCFVAKRNSWQPRESPESMNNYIWYLIQSDLTLCPAGYNTETYRVYEAMAAGSVPVIEDTPSQGLCADDGWRLLKTYDPPVIWIKNWRDLASILAKEQRMSIEEKIERRKQLIKWYASFKLKMKEKVISFLHDSLLKPD